MKLSDFKIGETFWMSDRPWRCTDIGTRVVTAIPLDVQRVLDTPPYDIVEHALDEYDLPACAFDQEGTGQGSAFGDGPIFRGREGFRAMLEGHRQRKARERQLESGLLPEGEYIDWSGCPEVERVPGKVSGVPILKNTRMQADGVWVAAFLDNMTPEEIAEEYRLDVEQVAAVIDYARRAVRHDRQPLSDLFAKLDAEPWPDGFLDRGSELDSVLLSAVRQITPPPIRWTDPEHATIECNGIVGKLTFDQTADACHASLLYDLRASRPMEVVRATPAIMSGAIAAIREWRAAHPERTLVIEGEELRALADLD